ncbi:MAG: aminoacyl-tRNA hydrolase [Candidatus Moranbacteria bacterium]|nr:aminoacyl-tRNA hydrolase [Candidatus Moranbacteria bacterium]NTW46197.1 aminoacyl-tRNA hydrolase [Candidatus Moranbacteria bacterium]
MPFPKLIVGLGNPGSSHERTRHNAGFLFLDFLVREWGFPPFESSAKWKGSVSTGLRGGEKVILLKPETFMNRSGESVRAVMDFFKFSPRDIVVIHDDLDVPAGTLKTTESSRAAGHNGVADLIEKLGTQDFRRVRVGIGRPSDGMPADAYVLAPFSDEERKTLESLFPEIESLIGGKTE